MIKQQIYNMIFKNIMDFRQITSIQLIHIIRKKFTKEAISDHEISEVFKLIIDNPNIAHANSTDGMYIEFFYAGPKFEIIENDELSNNNGLTSRDIEFLYDEALNYIKENKNVNVSSIGALISRVSESVGLKPDANEFIMLLNKLSCCVGMTVIGTIYPYDPDTRFVYELPSLEDFENTNNSKSDFSSIKLYEKSDPIYICPKCGNSVRKLLGLTLTSNPPKYKYVCDNDKCDYSAFHEV